MIVRPKHFQDSRERLDEMIREIGEAIREGLLPPEELGPYLQSEVPGYGPFFTVGQEHHHCFVCGEKLTIPCVMWHGWHGTKPPESQSIWMHQNCTKDLARLLARDATELEQEARNPPTP